MAKLSKISAPLIGIGIILVAGIIIGVWLRGGSKGVITTKSEQQMTDTQIASIQDIGQWELLTITDEEMADTTRTSFWGKSSLVRIYYGTLRLGINMKHTTRDDISWNHDTLCIALPPIELLDSNFIDEARTRSFYEQGQWTEQDRQALYYQARRKMLNRCITPQAYQSARNNAFDQMQRILLAMGYKKTRITLRKQ